MKHLLAQLVAGTPLSGEQAVEAFAQIMQGQATPAQIGALLALLAARGATEDEVVGAATVLRRKLVPVPVPAGMTVVDTCGTGGTHSRTFNISTTAGLVTAAIGRPRHVGVAKHGNRSVTSRSGSSEVLAALGVKVPVGVATLTRCLDAAGFCFCFAPAHHPAMQYAAPVRSELGFRTIFNLVGPLTNPAGARRQVLGVFAPGLTEPIARVLARLDAQHALVVHGFVPPPDNESAPPLGLGELTTTGLTHITRLHYGTLATFDLDARSLGLPRVDAAALHVDNAAHSAAVVRSVLAGERGPARDIVCLNAAAALWVTDLAADLQEGLALATQAIDAGQAMAVLEKVVRITQAEGG